MPTIKLLKSKRDSVPTIRKAIYQNIYQDKRWKFLVSSKKRVNPLCERCDNKGIVKQMEEVHHRIPFDTGKTPQDVEDLAFDFDNLESLCAECHEIRHKELKNI